MKYIIKNEYVNVSIDSKGAEVRSMKDSDGVEYIWQGDKAYWGGQAPNLFPYIGRLTEGAYYVEGERYALTKHGFARDMEFVLEEQTEKSLVFALEENEATLQMYPFKFKFSVIYTLEGSKLDICYKVENKEDRTMYFGIGGHPGFCVPLEDGMKFEDYYLEFSEVKNAVRVGIDDAGYVAGADVPYRLEGGVKIPLRRELFDHDAIVLRDMDTKVAMKCEQSSKGLEVTYPNMTYLGIWQVAHSDAPFVCIEPWTSLPSKAGVVGDFEQREDLVKLDGFGVYENQWSIKVL